MGEASFGMFADALPKKLYFDRLDAQGLPFYGGAVNYRIPKLHTPSFSQPFLR